MNSNENDYPIGRGSALDERRGPDDDSREILVKTPGNNSSLRLNARTQEHDKQTVWEVTLPFEVPLKLVKKDNKWVALGESRADLALIHAIGQAIDKQLSA
ncbi:hypothetical protein SAMN05216464_105321 [Mucilaginibacter pineti]|uniref:Uncharacterized protein n=1 Tax=Mucilaginibacter pineti TaxID=1391627 RepID=A0A1G7C9A9_9SPHI|nr:hypothetical protein [Mucilaginibacter pineti]SDE35340.1 hypothetical protein SAMN05216464_105321 [Mucilaginibacter pineti]